MSVKFKWDIEGNPRNARKVHIHTNVLFSKGTLEETYMEDSPQRKFEKILEKIHGVQDARVCRYKIIIERTKAVSWESIKKGVREAVNAHADTLELIL